MQLATEEGSQFLGTSDGKGGIPATEKICVKTGSSGLAYSLRNRVGGLQKAKTMDIGGRINNNIQDTRMVERQFHQSE